MSDERPLKGVYSLPVDEGDMNGREDNQARKILREKYLPALPEDKILGREALAKEEPKTYMQKPEKQNVLSYPHK
ncbi:MAG: hypothetical protein ACKO96_17315 [Flammeovirgaceae bacterium]